MEEQYNIEKLMVGHLSSIINFGASYHTIEHIEGPYIFLRINTPEGKKQKYKEIFTEDIYKLSDNREQQKFGKTYVVQDDIDIKEYMTEDEIKNGTITKRRLLNVYDTMKEKLLTKNRQKTKKR